MSHFLSILGTTSRRAGLAVCAGVWGCSPGESVNSGSSDTEASGGEDCSGEDVELSGHTYCAEEGPLEGIPFSSWCSGGAFLGDFDGDSNTDLVAIAGGDAVVGFGDANGFVDWQQLGEIGGSPASVFDWDGDGSSDLVFADGAAVRLLQADKFRTFSSTTIVEGLSPPPEDLAAGDFDGDGRTDLATARYVVEDGAAEVQVLLAAESYAPGMSAGLVADAAGVGPLLAVDADHDGLLDVIFGEFPEYRVRVAFGDGTGSFKDLTEIGRGRQVVASPDPSDGTRVDMVSRWMLSATEGFEWRSTRIGVDRAIVDGASAVLDPLSPFSPDETSLQYFANVQETGQGVWIAALQYGSLADWVLQLGVYPASDSAGEGVLLRSVPVSDSYIDCEVGAWAAPAKIDETDGAWWFVTSGDETSMGYLRLTPNDP